MLASSNLPTAQDPTQAVGPLPYSYLKKQFSTPYFIKKKPCRNRYLTSDEARTYYKQPNKNTVIVRILGEGYVGRYSNPFLHDLVIRYMYTGILAVLTTLKLLRGKDRKHKLCICAVNAPLKQQTSRPSNQWNLYQFTIYTSEMNNFWVFYFKQINGRSEQF